MARLSSRITTLNDAGSDGWEVFYRARQMIAAGEQVTELTIGEHDIGTDATILDALSASAKGGHTGYAMVPGVDALRDAIAARVQARTDVTTTRDNILVTPGAQSALFSAHMAACAPGDTALFIDPYYTTYPGTIRAASAIPHAVPTSADNAFSPTARAVSKAAKDTDAKSLLINSPNNPTGTVYSKKTLQALAQSTQDHDLWLISDEVYDTQIWDGEHISPRALPGMAERTMVIGSMSKSHAMTGSRIGWIVAPPDAIETLIDLATATTYGVPGYIQDAAHFALTQNPTLESTVSAPFKRRRTLVLSILADQTAVKAIPAQGAMYLMLDIQATGLSGRDFAEALLDARHIAVMPGESFGRSAAGHIRVALTVDDARLAQAIRELCAFAESHVKTL